MIDGEIRTFIVQRSTRKKKSFDQTMALDDFVAFNHLLNPEDFPKMVRNCL